MQNPVQLIKYGHHEDDKELRLRTLEASPELIHLMGSRKCYLFKVYENFLFFRKYENDQDIIIIFDNDIS